MKRLVFTSILKWQLENMWLVKGLTAHVLATSFFSKIQPWNPQTQSHGSNSSWSGQAAVPIPEDYALTSYFYVHIAYRHVSVNHSLRPTALKQASTVTSHSIFQQWISLFLCFLLRDTCLHLSINFITSLSLILPLQLLTMQVKARIENEQYLRKHPEIAAMVSSFVR